MANTVKISTIGPRPLAENPGPGQAAVDRMLAFWRGKLDQVLPDRPDLIVLPEASDRYPAHSMAERLAYYRARGNQVRDLFVDGRYHDRPAGPGQFDTCGILVRDW